MTTRIASFFVLSALALCAQAQTAYPVVDKLSQKARDDDRRVILQTELQAESDSLAKAHAASDAPAIHRHSENIKALRRELGIPNSKPTADAFRHDEIAPAVVRVVRDAPPAAPPPRPVRFWDPYSRNAGTTDFPTTPRRDLP
jgi:hypothetical protein